MSEFHRITAHVQLHAVYHACKPGSRSSVSQAPPQDHSGKSTVLRDVKSATACEVMKALSEGHGGTSDCIPKI